MPLSPEEQRFIAGLMQSCPDIATHEASSSSTSAAKRLKTEDVKKEEVKKEISDDDGNTTPGLSSVVVDATANDYLNAAVSKSAVQKAAVVKAGAIDVKAAGLPTETSMIGPPKPPAKPPPLHLVVAKKLLARKENLKQKVLKGSIKGVSGISLRKR